MTNNLKSIVLGCSAVVVGLIVCADCLANEPVPIGSSPPIARGGQRCPNNQGPCFGTGSCEAWWNDPAFECPPRGTSLKQTWSIMFGGCVDDESQTCYEYGTLVCAGWTVYSQAGCNLPLCSMQGVVWSKCH